MQDEIKTKIISLAKRAITENEVAVNNMGSSSSIAGSGPIDTIDPLLAKKSNMMKRLSDILNKKKNK